MQLRNAFGGLDGAAVEQQKQEAAELVLRYRSEIRPFIEKHGEQLAPLDNDAERIERLLRLSYTVTACFLGHSGIRVERRQALGVSQRRRSSTRV
jgi:hypothetical protein